MQKMSPVNVLSEIRTESARLQLREARLAALLAIGESTTDPRIASRPGWPMQRGRQVPDLHLQ